MRRRLIITSVWVVGTIVAIALSVSAVGMVGQRVAGRDTTLVSPAGVEQALAETTTSLAPGSADAIATSPEELAAPSDSVPAGSSDGPETAFSPEPSPAPESEPQIPSAVAPAGAGATGIEEVYVTSGGTVGVRCTGGTISLLYATPAPGWTIHDSAKTGPAEVEVRFEPAEDAHGAEARVRVTCQAGVPVEEIRESD